MDYVCLVHRYVVTIAKAFTYIWSDRQVDYIFEGGNTAPHENVYIQKINLEKNAKKRKFNEDNFF